MRQSLRHKRFQKSSDDGKVYGCCKLVHRMPLLPNSTREIVIATAVVRCRECANVGAWHVRTQTSYTLYELRPDGLKPRVCRTKEVPLRMD